MWYVIQIMTGKEEMMREMITRNLPSKMYEDCFYIRRDTDLAPEWRESMSCRNDVSGLSVCDDRRPGSNILETQRNPGTYETSADRGEPVFVSIAGGTGLFGRFN